MGKCPYFPWSAEGRILCGGTCRDGQGLSADETAVFAHYRDVFEGFVAATLLQVTKRPLADSRVTRMPSTADEVTTLRAKDLLRVTGSFRNGLVSSSDFFMGLLYHISDAGTSIFSPPPATPEKNTVLNMTVSGLHQ